MYIKHLTSFLSPKNNFFYIYLFSASHFTFITGIMVGYFDDLGLTGDKIALLFLIKRISRIALDMPMGILFELVGPKATLATSRIANIIRLALLFDARSFSVLIFAFIFDACAEASSFGKTETYFYNYKEKNHKHLNYEKLLAIFYFLTDLTISLFVLIGAKMYKLYSFNQVLKASILCSVFSLLLLRKIEKPRIIVGASKKQHHGSIVGIIKDMKGVVLTTGLMLALLNGFVWEAMELTQVVFAAQELDTYQMGIYASILHGTLTCGSILPLFISDKISVKLFTALVLSLPVFGLVAFFVKNSAPLILACMVVYLLFYASLEIKLINQIDENSKTESRSSRVAIFQTIEGLLRMIAISFFSAIYAKFNYQLAFVGFLAIYFLFGLIIFIYDRYSKLRHSAANP